VMIEASGSNMQLYGTLYLEAGRNSQCCKLCNLQCRRQE